MEISALLAAARRGERLTPEQALHLYRHAPLAELGATAAAVKERKSGREVYYNRNIHIEPTNICRFACRFCSYRRGAGDPEAWNLSLDQIEQLALDQRDTGITEVHIVGGVHPDHTLGDYIAMVRRVKRALPGVAVKAFTAIELGEMILAAGLSLDEGLRRLKEAGMEAIPGGGAEIFDEAIRAKICPEKGDSRLWLDVHRAAHGLGIPTNATMLYGHIESPEHRVDHMNRLRELQDITGGFDAFIPLKFRHRGNSMEGIGEVAVTDDLRTLALARLFLDNFPHIKAYWPMYGRTTTELALAFGADDIDGTISGTTKIYSMAGAEEQRPSLGIEDLQRMAAAAGYVAVERDTFYRKIESR